MLCHSSRFYILYSPSCSKANKRSDGAFFCLLVCTLAAPFHAQFFDFPPGRDLHCREPVTPQYTSSRRTCCDGSLSALAAATFHPKEKRTPKVSKPTVLMCILSFPTELIPSTSLCLSKSTYFGHLPPSWTLHAHLKR